MQVTLDSAGNWAQLKEVADLRRADRRAVNQAIVVETDPKTRAPIIRGSLDDDIADATLKHVVENWSLPFPLPSADPASLDKLTLEQDDALRKAIQPHIDALQGKNAPTKENPDPTPASAS